MNPPTPAPFPVPTQSQDREHLRLLSIFHYVAGGMLALFSCLALIYVVIGMVLLAAPQRGGGPPPAIIGGLLMVVGFVFLLGGLGLAGLLCYAGHSLGNCRHRTFCLVVAAISCLWTPIGTVLGVFTIIVLLRPSVQALFGLASPPVPK